MSLVETIFARSCPLIPSHLDKSLKIDSLSSTPFGSLAIIPFRKPFFLIWLVRSLVSIPYKPTILFLISQSFKLPSERQLEGLVIGLLKIAPLILEFWLLSISWKFIPTFPICGKVNVIICEVYDGSVIIS